MVKYAPRKVYIRESGGYVELSYTEFCRCRDLEQRLGRIQRQGNTYDHVRDYRYVTEGTFDAYSYQTVERKQRFISQLMSSKSPAREAADLDADVVTLANIKALATGDPDIQRRMTLECIASMFVGRVRQCFSAVWADGFPRCRHRFPVM